MACEVLKVKKKSGYSEITKTNRGLAYEREIAKTLRILKKIINILNECYRQ